MTIARVIETVDRWVAYGYTYDECLGVLRERDRSVRHFSEEEISAAIQIIERLRADGLLPDRPRSHAGTETYYDEELIVTRRRLSGALRNALPEAMQKDQIIADFLMSLDSNVRILPKSGEPT